MKYISTRGNSPQVSFNQAIIQGLAPDGGLYVPVEWAKLDRADLDHADEIPYYQTAAKVLKIFAGDDFDQDICLQLAKKAYGDNWSHIDIVPTSYLKDGVYLMELFHGPSLAFKDVAMQFIGQLFEYVLEQENKKLSVICATSGDTGGAAVEAFKNKKNIELFVLMPDGRVSEVQKRFMTASNGANVHALILDKDFDKAQAILKSLFADKEFVELAHLAPVNSVNIARIMAQCVYFIIAAAKYGKNAPVDFIVPTGNFGDALSGYVAKKLGANIGKIIIANNANNSISVALETGVFAIDENSIATISPAMDIQVASNFERILYDSTDGDPQQKSGAINKYYSELKSARKFEINPNTLENLRAEFIPNAIGDDETRMALKQCFEQTNVVICPHTAVGWSGLQKSNANAKVILATAHAAKFPETIVEILGIDPPLPKNCADLFERKENFEFLSADEEIVKSYIQKRI